MQTPDIPMFILSKGLQVADEFQLRPEDAHHALNVMRMRPDDQLLVCNGHGIIWTCKISNIKNKEVECSVISKIVDLKKNPYHVSLLISQLKNNNRLEMAIEKSVEQGVREILLCKTQRSSHKPFQARRIQRIVDAAVKQSKKAFVPLVNYFDSLPEVLEANSEHQKLMASCISDSMHINHMELSEQNTLLAIGPEGDFTPAELDTYKNSGGKVCSLGKERLRSETAAIVGLSQLKMKLNEI